MILTVLQSGETMDYILECGYYLAGHLSEKKFNNTKENNWKALNIYYISKLAITDYRINNANFPILYVNSLNSISYSKLGLGMNDIYIIFKNYVLDHFVNANFKLVGKAKSVFIFLFEDLNKLISNKLRLENSLKISKSSKETRELIRLRKAAFEIEHDMLGIDVDMSKIYDGIDIYKDDNDHLN